MHAQTDTLQRHETHIKLDTDTDAKTQTYTQTQNTRQTKTQTHGHTDTGTCCGESGDAPRCGWRRACGAPWPARRRWPCRIAPAGPRCSSDRARPHDSALRGRRNRGEYAVSDCQRDNDRHAQACRPHKTTQHHTTPQYHTVNAPAIVSFTSSWIALSVSASGGPERSVAAF